MAAGREILMKGLFVGQVELTVGAKKYSLNLTVEPNKNDMLLGFDILLLSGQGCFRHAQSMRSGSCD